MYYVLTEKNDRSKHFLAKADTLVSLSNFLFEFSERYEYVHFTGQQFDVLGEMKIGIIAL